MKEDSVKVPLTNVKNVWLLSFITSIAVELCFLEYGLALQDENLTGIWVWIKKTNFNFYFTVLLVFFTSFLISRFLAFCIVKNWKFNLRSDYSLFWKIVTLIGVISVVSLLLNWLFVQIYFEPHPPLVRSLPIATLPMGYILVIGTSGVMLITWAILEHKDCPSALTKYVYSISVVLTFWALYSPNIFVADLHHGVAALESIFNVADLTPFTYTTTGIYGHYGIFFCLPLRIFGCSIENVVALMAIFGCIACVCVLYVIHNLMPRNWMRIMAALASVYHLVIYRGGRNYWQIQPLRIFFPCIFMAYAVYLCKSKVTNYKLKVISGWLLGILAVLWNTESGIFCLFAFVAFLLTECWQEHKWYSKKMWCIYAGAIVFIIFAILGSVAILNIYNLICGGPLVFRTFFFPLQVEEYMIDVLEWDLAWGNYAWVYALVLFFLLLCWGLYHTQWFHKKSNTILYMDMAPAAVLVATLGLLSFSYYANRAAMPNLDICFPMAICAIALIIGKLWPQFTGKKIISFEISCKKTGVTVCLLALFALSIQLLYTPVPMKEKDEVGAQSTISLRQEAGRLRNTIPENTYGMGYGISIIYHILGWDNYGHFRDVSDLGVGGNDALNEMVKSTLQQDSFLCNNKNLSRTIRKRVLKKDWHYQLEASIMIQGTEYLYYVRRPYVVSAKVDKDNTAIYFTFRDDDVYTSIKATVGNEKSEKKDWQWVSLNKNEKGIWEGHINLHNSAEAEKYVVQFYSLDEYVPDYLTETSVEVAAMPTD